MKYSLIVLALTVALTPCFGQGASTPNSQFTVIHGKEHPELIDDATCYLHLFRALERTSNESEEVFKRRRQAIAGEIGLESSQIPAVFAAADAFVQRAQVFDSQPPGPQRRAARAQMTMSLVAQLQQTLGAHGAYVLAQYINNVVKPRVTLYLPR